ncbi:MAG TPA: DUF58 domain-containing protein [Tepidisphaeraceae bacterium]|nr:DUF58 domain-containing protein [Tepidisphaeraceae bacterium]
MPLAPDLLDPDFVARLDRLDILSRKILAGKLRGERLTRHKGSSVDLADFRDYTPGDDIRFIDWNIFARLDRLLVKLFLAEEDFFLHILMDVSKSTDYGDPNKADYLRRLAAALGYVGLVNQGWVTITAMADRITAATSLLRGRKRLPELLRFLGGQDPAGMSRFAESCARFIRARRHKGICVVLSDFLFRDVRAGLQLLSAAGHDLYCIQVLSPQELDPVFRGDIRLIDAESGDAVDASANSIGQYKKNLNAHCRQVAGEVRRRGGIFVEASTEIPFDELILDGLRRRGLLHG